MKLSLVQIRTLAALYVMQPCTVSALNVELKGEVSYDPKALRSLEKLGLVTKEKSPSKALPREVREDYEFRGIPKPRTSGRRPFLYTLTPGAVVLAEYLHCAEVLADKVLADD